jgi:DNA gyrase subunit B
VTAARQARQHLAALARRAPVDLLEALALEDGLHERALEDAATALLTAQAVARRLDAAGRGGWQALHDDAGGLIFQKQQGDRRERYRIEPALVRSPEARRLGEAFGALRPVFARPASLLRKDASQPVHGPVGLVEAVLEAARKGLTVQRYKGLGEMNPAQLWETTLDPAKRVLLQVRVDHADAANSLFETLMGDTVDPRREFIQENALKVVNLDV